MKTHSNHPLTIVTRPPADTLKQWCDPNPLLKVVRRIINQPNDLFLTRENALQITHRWESTFYDECVFTVESQQGSGLILNVNQMYFRSDPRDPLNECVDYFRIKYNNGTKSQRMCGRLNATVTSSSTMALRSFVVPDGKVEIKIRIDENRKLSPREHLYVDFLFTQYDGEYMMWLWVGPTLHCGYCIAMVVFSCPEQATAILFVWFTIAAIKILWIKENMSSLLWYQEGFKYSQKVVICSNRPLATLTILPSN